jgi:hypothetical protein
LIDQELKGEGTAKPLGEWALSLPVILDGRRFTFRKHEYLIEPYADTHPDQTFQKAAQLGLTSLAMLRAIHSARYRNFRGILYLFPSRFDVTDFSKGRVAPLIEQNPETIGRWVRETDAANIKQIHNCFLYFRGMKSRAGLKSIPADCLILDELDEAPEQNAVDMAMERLSHSEHKEVLKLSNPTLPDYGIDKAFQETDQRYWLLKCPKCGKYTCLEDTFPECLIETKDKVIRACEKCKAELNPSAGQWVAKRPNVEKRGYHFSQLFSHYVEPKDILHQFRTTTNLTDFYNLKIGIAYVVAENRLSVQEVLSLCGSDGMLSECTGPCSMGVDQGRDLHVVIGAGREGKAGQIVHIGIYKDWEELDRLMKNFNVACCVVDALPEQRNARAFAERHRGRVYLNFYNQYQKGSYAWNARDLIVQGNRTESLDASHTEIMAGRIVLPKESDVTREFAKHLHNTAKKLEEDEETGSKRYVYVKLGPDHFRHAFNYEAMARQKAGLEHMEGRGSIQTAPSLAVRLGVQDWSEMTSATGSTLNFWDQLEKNAHDRKFGGGDW